MDRSELLALILETGKAGPIANAAVRQSSGLERHEALALLEHLVQDGEIVRVGERRGTRYVRPENISPGVQPREDLRRGRVRVNRPVGDVPRRLESRQSKVGPLQVATLTVRLRPSA